jgi:cell division protein FtsA
LDNAEKIKILLGKSEEITPQRPDESREEYRRRLRSRDVLNLADVDPNLKTRTLYKSTLINTVVSSRLKELFSLIEAELKNHNLQTELGAGAVVVGGAAKTVSLPEVASEVLNMQVRLGVPKGISGVIRHLDDPALATAVGLLHYAVRAQVVSPETQLANEGKNSPFDRFFDKIKKAVKHFAP